MFSVTEMITHRSKGAIVALICFAGFIGCRPDPEKAKTAFVESGKRYVAQGKYQEATIQFRNALKIDPRYSEAYYQLGKADLAMKQWRDAYAALLQAADLDPSRSDIQLSLAEMYLTASDYKKAQESTSKILQKEPSNSKAQQYLGAALVGQQDYEGAEKAFLRAVQLSPSDPSVYTSLALIELRERKLLEAEQHLNKTLDLDPHLALGYDNLATLYRVQKQNDKAEAVLRRGIQSNPDAIPLYVSLLEVLRLEGNQAQLQATIQRLHSMQQYSVVIATAIGDWYTGHLDLNDAAAEYHRGLDRDPKNTDLKLKLVETYLNSVKLNEAAALNDQVLAEQPSNIIARINRARLLASQGKLDEATNQLLGQIKDTPDSAEAHYYLALVYSAKNNVEQAKNELNTTLKLTPDSRLAARALAQIHVAQRDYTLAQETLQRNLTSGSPELVDLVLMGDILLREGDAVRAREQYLWAQQLAPDNPVVSLGLAAVDEKEKKYSDAEEHFQKAVHSSPGDLPTLSAYADFLVRRNQPDRAIQLLKQFVASDPRRGAAHLALASTYMNLKRSSEASGELSQALQLDPKLVQGYVLLAEMKRDQGDLDGALSNCLKAIALQPRSSALQTLAGNLYLMKNEYPAARKYFEQALALDENAAIAASNLAWITARENGNLDVALGLAQKAKRLMPQVDSITDTLGWVEYRKGLYSSSVPLFQECVQDSPTIPAYHFHLGMALMASGESAKAKSELQSAIRFKLAGEDAAEAQQALLRLK